MINLPIGVKLLTLALIAFHAGLSLLPPDKGMALVLQLAFVPIRFAGTGLLDAQAATLITHMFVHGGWMHVLINVAMLMAFGTGIERAAGPWRLFALFLACGALGAVAHFFLFIGSGDPMIGASGGISGLFGGILRLMPGGNDIRRLAPFIALWIGLSFLFGLLGAPGSNDAVAWVPHVAGFLAGLALAQPVCFYKNRRRF